MSRSSRWVVSELPSSEDLDPYPVTDAPPPTPSTVKSRETYVQQQRAPRHSTAEPPALEVTGSADER